MISIEELRALEGFEWIAKPRENLASQDTLLWAAVEELASALEVELEPEHFIEAEPRIVLIIAGAVDYFLEIGHPPPHAAAHVLLMAERLKRGLTARGGDK
ncbi:hypothetical protein GVN21_13065 [Caulobacter sp. SLTY]|uniref:hypothetical protein n=1 Tax=Caulobacter sp. SLTY TaxID=2683262 RepID=UPI0014127B15|nr:hypothetical protein [Caulobacter sp. SLTY]NBB16290.1 hypothetical protein [Caulobacter sp. SLTY]